MSDDWLASPCWPWPATRPPPSTPNHHHPTPLPHLQVCGPPRGPRGVCLCRHVILQGIQLPHQVLLINILWHAKGGAHDILNLLVVVLQGEMERKGSDGQGSQGSQGSQ